MMIYPTLDEIRQLRDREMAVKAHARKPLLPICCDILADMETPVSAFCKIASGPYSFLLESVVGGEHIARYSFIGINPYLVMKHEGHKATLHWSASDRDEYIEEIQCSDPLVFIQAELGQYYLVDPPGIEHDSLPSFHGGAVGYLAYEAAARFEHLPVPEKNALGLPLAIFCFTETVLIFDHLKHRVRIVTHLHLDTPDLQAEYMREGDIFQVVLSQRLSRYVNAAPFTIYRALRSINPSPYMFFLDFQDIHIIGASPELLVRVEDGEVTIHPIAGTRRRGEDPHSDQQLAVELKNDPKERAEHVMLVDLGRNDVGRVSLPGSVKVSKFMEIERYSHVMHLVSNVTGQLRPELTSYDALRAGFPAGTVSGAPKIRAMEIISELEGEQRGIYAGAVGYFSHSGNQETAIALRTMVIKDGRAYIQAGCGVVADSNPSEEYQESLNKAKALLRALEEAENISKEQRETYASINR